MLAGFTEGDAAKLQIGQPATVTVAALPGQELAATVSEIDTLQTVVSNVVTYNVTSTSIDTVPGLKPGMTANVAVIVSEKDNVLHVPTAAVSHARAAIDGDGDERQDGSRAFRSSPACAVTRHRDRERPDRGPTGGRLDRDQYRPPTTGRRHPDRQPASAARGAGAGLGGGGFGGGAARAGG